MSEENHIGSLLVIIFDTNPVWWGQKCLRRDSNEMTITKCLEALLAFCNAHLMMKDANKLAVIASHTNSCKFLYPKPELDSEPHQSPTAECRSPTTEDQYELFTQVDKTICDELEQSIMNDHSAELHSDCSLAGALCMALCYINRVNRELDCSRKITSRILVIKGAEDHTSQYLDFMNCVFTAHKLDVLIDACILDNDSSLLQQGCDITSGIYLKTPQLSGLLQYLLWVFLPDVYMRKTLTLPPRVQVDYRTACFCHRNLIDVGFMCSTCLSIFCTFSPICSTCHATFKLRHPRKDKK